MFNAKQNLTKPAWILMLFGLINVALPSAAVSDWLWVKQYYGEDNDHCTSMAIDHDGNIYLAGSFESELISFDDFDLNNKGDHDIYLAKVSPAGNVLWAICAGGMDSEYIEDIATDGQGNIYITGSFSSDTLGIDGIDLVRTDTAEAQLFIFKFNASGTALWGRSATNGKRVEGLGIAIDSGATDLYITGIYEQNNLDLGGNVLTNGGEEDVFLAKYTTGGQIVWAEKGGGSSAETVGGIAVNDQTIVITGAFGSSSCSFGSKTLNRKGLYDFFLVAYDENGDPLWAETSTSGGFGSGADVAVNESDEVWILGNFASDSFQVGTDWLVSGGEEDIFLAKYDAAGTPQWGVSAGGEGNERASSLDIDEHGFAFCAGVINEFPVLFDFFEVNSQGLDDPFLAKYDPAGNIRWVQTTGGSGEDRAFAVALNADNQIYVAGNYNSQEKIPFGPDTLPPRIGGADIWLTKLSAEIDTALSLPSFVQESLMVYPNPNTGGMLTIAAGHFSEQKVSLYHSTGSRVAAPVQRRPSGQWIVDTSGLPAGLYLVVVEFNDTNHRAVKKLVILD